MKSLELLIMNRNFLWRNSYFKEKEKTEFKYFSLVSVYVRLDKMNLLYRLEKLLILREKKIFKTSEAVV